MTNIKGSCHCKKVLFELTPPTELCSHCHCKSCRKTHGAAFVTWTSVPDKNLTITTGEDLLHKYKSNPGVVWMNCKHCSSPLFQTTSQSPGRTYITVASLDGKLDREPDSHVSFEEHVNWVAINDKLPKHKAKASDQFIKES
ncbi:MAG: GFA family protein [Bdellovibrionales bacterium]